MPSGSSDLPQPVGNLALAKFASVPASFLRCITWVAGTRKREIAQEIEGFTRVERTLPLVYLPDPAQGILGHVAFALRGRACGAGALRSALASSKATASWSVTVSGVLSAGRVALTPLWLT